MFQNSSLRLKVAWMPGERTEIGVEKVYGQKSDGVVTAIQTPEPHLPV